MRKLNSILIANRGEIAIRVIRAARTLGYRTVAVYSQADAGAPHVALADSAVAIGPAPANQSYLNVERLLAAADAAGADAVHPGYGFLSENAAFAQACVDRGLTFIGPDPEVIALMGDKAAARRRMAQAGVPCVPGYDGEDQSERTLREAAVRIGFPVMVKAAAGGGGRGMRLVGNVDDLPAALQTARSEAENAFGCGTLILEKAVLRPRHVEIQVFADAQGNVVHLGERDCSVQRRHQKVLEESPCPVMTPELRQQMGAAAVAAARAVSYRGAGTVEFLLDGDGAFYFLEMNTRIQVEHPVTEAVTGLDLVGLQLRVAEGLPLGFEQQDVTLTGHAIEARLYAEEPGRDFLPATGRIDLWRPPTGEGVRCDDGIASGMEISPYYDPMLAKIVAWSESREIARARLVEALKASVIFGPPNNRHFLIEALQREAFAEGTATTAFIAEQFTPQQLAAPTATPEELAAAAVLLYRARRQTAAGKALGLCEELFDWSSAGVLVSRFVFADQDLIVTPDGAGGYRVVIAAGDTLKVTAVHEQDGQARLRIDDVVHAVQYLSPTEHRIRLSVEGRDFDFEDQLASVAIVGNSAADGQISAPMHGIVLEVFVQPGDRVTAGQRLAVLEAMKMQHDILASADSEVAEVFCQPAQQVSADSVLFELTLDES